MSGRVVGREPDREGGRQGCMQGWRSGWRSGWSVAGSVARRVSRGESVFPLYFKVAKTLKYKTSKPMSETNKQTNHLTLFTPMG